MNRPSPSNMLHSYRKRKNPLQGPVLIYGIAALLVLGGLILLIVWLFQPMKPLNLMFATDTPTATVTPSPTTTSTPTMTPTETVTPTLTATATPSAPFTYTIQEGEYLQSLVEKFGLGNDGVGLILLLNPYTSEGAANSIDPSRDRTTIFGCIPTLISSSRWRRARSMPQLSTSTTWPIPLVFSVPIRGCAAMVTATTETFT